MAKLTNIRIDSIFLGDIKISRRRANRGRPVSSYTKKVEEELKLDPKTTLSKLVAKHYPKARADEKKRAPEALSQGPSR